MSNIDEIVERLDDLLDDEESANVAKGGKGQFTKSVNMLVGIADLRALLNDHKRLKEIVAKLRKDANGNPVTGLESIYCPKGHEIADGFVDIIGNVATCTDKECCWGGHTWEGEWEEGSETYDISDCYSTRSAAEAAKKENHNV